MLEALYRSSLKSMDGQWNGQWPQSASHNVTVHLALAFKSVCVFTGLILAFLVGAPMDLAAVTAATALLVWANRPPRAALEAVDWLARRGSGLSAFPALSFASSAMAQSSLALIAVSIAFTITSSDSDQDKVVLTSSVMASDSTAFACGGYFNILVTFRAACF